MDNTILIRARLFALLLLFLINPYNINSAATGSQSSSLSSSTLSSSATLLKLGNLCKLSEFQCKTQTSIVSNRSTCIPLIKYCDGVYDCHDKSDEPQLCSICNRTYFGETGKTYELEIPQPKEFPFLCHLNFTAGGGNYGDLIQINFDKFNVGRFQPSFGGGSSSSSSTSSSSTSTSSHHGHESSKNRDRCLDGYMKIREKKNSIQNTLSSTSSSTSSSSSTLSKYFNFNNNNNNNNNNNILNSNSNNNNNNNNINYDDGGSGEWCGSAWGYTVYYSETHSINITIKLDKFLQQNSPENNFEFKLSFKFLKRNEAKLRYDGGIWTGEHVTGTYCDKNLYDCDKRICRIRSPNFPGIYPRNLTCKYLIQYRQPPPAGLHAMIAVRQPDGHKIHIKEQGPNFEQNNRALKSWDQCERGQDFLSIQDGKTINSPELARICGGDSVPDIISSGPSMLIEFKTAAVDSLFHPNPISYLLGFELQVHIMYVNSNSQAYVRQPGQCEFILSAYESPSGELTPPQHTLPPNTICRYQFQGRRHEIVWISFIKYHSTLDSAIFQPSECSAQLRIWDGRLMLPSSSSSSASNFSRTDGTFGGNNNGGNDLYRQHQYYRNASLMDEICGEETPKLCSRSLIAKGTRPCSSQESYLSTGPEMTIEFKPSPSGNAKAYGPNASFKLKYEFVDTSLGGAPMDASSTLYQTKPSSMPEPAALVTQTQFKSCDRVYRSFSSKRGIFRSPSNVFMFGRGGAPNISCTIRFEASMGESVRLTITRARFGGRACQNIQNRSGRWHCNDLGGPRSDLRIGELPWPDISPLPRDCLCSDISGSLTLAPLAASVVEVQFTTMLMDVDQDFRDFYFEGRYEFAMDGCETLWNERRLKGRSGEAFLKPTSCSPLIQPWLLEPETDGGYLVLKLKGFWMPTMLQSAPPCPTDARITVYPTNNPKNAKDLCPSGPEVVAFSDGWEHANEFNPIETSKGLIIEYRSPWKPGVEIFDYKFSWMEVFPGTECPYQCPELQACIPSELWCDGVAHCPSGYDESATQCEIRLPLSPLHVGLGAATLTILLSLAAGLAACFRRKRVEKKQIHQNHHHHLEANGRHHHPHYHLPPPPPTSTLPHHHNLPPIYLDSSAKDSFC